MLQEPEMNHRIEKLYLDKLLKYHYRVLDYMNLTNIHTNSKKDEALKKLTREYIRDLKQIKGMK